MGKNYQNHLEYIEVDQVLEAPLKLPKEGSYPKPSTCTARILPNETVLLQNMSKHTQVEITFVTTNKLMTQSPQHSSGVKDHL